MKLNQIWHCPRPALAKSYLALLAAGIMTSAIADQERDWRRDIEPTLLGLDLPLPPPARDLEHGRSGHGEAFRWLHGQFTMVRRGDPEATW